MWWHKAGDVSWGRCLSKAGRVGQKAEAPAFKEAADWSLKHKEISGISSVLSHKLPNRKVLISPSEYSSPVVNKLCLWLKHSPDQAQPMSRWIHHVNSTQ